MYNKVHNCIQFAAAILQIYPNCGTNKALFQGSESNCVLSLFNNCNKTNYFIKTDLFSILQECYCQPRRATVTSLEII